jgi:hypothetical protein
MRKHRRFWVVLSGVSLCLILGFFTAWATELVYTPINPSFGGNPLNGQFLLGIAQAQNSFTEEFKGFDALRHIPKPSTPSGNNGGTSGSSDQYIEQMIINIYQDGSGNLLEILGW